MIIDLKKKDFLIILPIAIVLILIIVYTYFQMFPATSQIKLKKNKANTYHSSYITNDKQAAIYLSNYYNLLNYEVDKAYELLDDSMKKKWNQNTFKQQIELKNWSSTKIQKFRIYSEKGYNYYDIYDVNNNHILFKTNGVMQYSVIIKN